MSTQRQGKLDLSHYQDLYVCQQVEQIEALFGFETANQYAVFTPDGDEVLYAFEESGAISRQFLGSHRPLDIHLVDNRGDLVLTEPVPSIGSTRTFR